MQALKSSAGINRMAIENTVLDEAWGRHHRTLYGYTGLVKTGWNGLIGKAIQPY
jgi:hypothetical protein